METPKMYRKIKVFSLIASLMAFSLPAAAVDDLLESVATGCEKELTQIVHKYFYCFGIGLFLRQSLKFIFNGLKLW